MKEESKNRIYTISIILIFLLLGFITWQVYDYQIHRIDHSARMKDQTIKPITN